MKRLSKEQILMLHSQLIEQTGGTPGVRDFNLLESAIEMPFQAFDGVELYPTIQRGSKQMGSHEPSKIKVFKERRAHCRQSVVNFLSDLIWLKIYDFARRGFPRQRN